MKLWQITLLAYKYSKISASAQFLMAEDDMSHLFCVVRLGGVRGQGGRAGEAMKNGKAMRFKKVGLPNQASAQHSGI